ncbi:hypothetical protein PAPYR_6819 [Paratrimastix pyriformis]|uniref:Uncharacterized protein n=1 Tax=Paratrimastix pyriformis TaxID=342808 RepID=A0ABQ8UEF7_9EUKA|nr:hypothetical protein PAPYR_6819 [Paratrimastix pyriformis]
MQASGHGAGTHPGQPGVIQGGRGERRQKTGPPVDKVQDEEPEKEAEEMLGIRVRIGNFGLTRVPDVGAGPVFKHITRFGWFRPFPFTDPFFVRLTYQYRGKNLGPVFKHITRNDPDLRRGAAACLINLSVNARNKEAIIGAGGLAVLMSLMRCDDLEAVRFAVRTAGNLALDEKCRGDMLTSGIAVPLVLLVGSRDPTAVLYAERTVGQLASIPEGARALYDLKVVEALTAVLQRTLQRPSVANPPPQQAPAQGSLDGAADGPGSEGLLGEALAALAQLGAHPQAPLQGAVPLLCQAVLTLDPPQALLALRALRGAIVVGAVSQPALAESALAALADAAEHYPIVAELAGTDVVPLLACLSTFPTNTLRCLAAAAAAAHMSTADPALAEAAAATARYVLLAEPLRLSEAARVAPLLVALLAPQPGSVAHHHAIITLATLLDNDGVRRYLVQADVPSKLGPHLASPLAEVSPPPAQPPVHPIIPRNVPKRHSAALCLVAETPVRQAASEVLLALAQDAELPTMGAYYQQPFPQQQQPTPAQPAPPTTVAFAYPTSLPRPSSSSSHHHHHHHPTATPVQAPTTEGPVYGAPMQVTPRGGLRLASPSPSAGSYAAQQQQQHRSRSRSQQPLGHSGAARATSVPSRTAAEGQQYGGTYASGTFSTGPRR